MILSDSEGTDGFAVRGLKGRWSVEVDIPGVRRPVDTEGVTRPFVADDLPLV